MNNKDLSIAIVGGGYGGAAAALALTKNGFTNVKVYEQAPGMSEVGAGIGLRPEVVQFFRDYDSFHAIEAVSTPSDQFRILTAEGHPIHSEEWPHINDYPQPNKTRMIHRADFIDALRSVLPEGVLVLDHKLVDIVDNGSSATLSFENGNEITADLVIGADGIRSLVRNKLFSQVQPVFQRTHAYRIVIDAADAEGTLTDGDLRLFMGNDGTMIYHLPLLQRNQLSFDITVLSDDDAWAPIITTEYLVEKVKDFAPELIEITRNLDIPKITSRSGYDLDSLDSWHTDSVALLGDSAHAMLWHQGQGANSAILDGDGIAKALLATNSVPEALAAYQAARKPVTDELQATSRASWDPDKVDTAFPGAQKD